MRIGELAKITGLAPSRIRFYEASGLIRSVDRKANGYRDYADEIVWVLEMITTAQTAGFSLEEIRSLLPINSTGWLHDELLLSLKRKIEEIEALELRLACNKKQLFMVVESIESKPDGMPCIENTQQVLDRLREGMVLGKECAK
ncbi:MerR family transcriptional regulator [Pseudomonas allokribbensis]|uniref:MerR family transcriptional regulator n=1 Tax=Pseudomonas allokribbensis TaxID=2774460 RepID=UPI0017889EFC|nr:MerR family transcriptional regulator [Pseudomonas allokribbensis]